MFFRSESLFLRPVWPEDRAGLIAEMGESFDPELLRQDRCVPPMLITLPGDAGASVEFNEVLLGSDGSTVRTGVPYLTGAKVTGEIVKHGRGEKIVVFKFKRRKNYARKQGHRQGFTEVRIKDITLG